MDTGKRGAKKTTDQVSKASEVVKKTNTAAPSSNNIYETGVKDGAEKLKVVISR